MPVFRCYVFSNLLQLAGYTAASLTPQSCPQPIGALMVSQPCVLSLSPPNWILPKHAPIQLAWLVVTMVRT